MNATMRVKVDEWRLQGVGLDDLYPARFDELRPPWAYDDEAQFRELWPSSVTVVPLESGENFRARVKATLDKVADGGRVVIQLEADIYQVTEFEPAGSSGDPAYAFGIWHGAKLQGFVGRGPDKTFIDLAPECMTQAQLERIGSFKRAAFKPIQISFARIDPEQDSPGILAGLTFRGADQQGLPFVQDDVNINPAHPAPYNGVRFFGSNSTRWRQAIVSYCRFQGAARAAMSQPPYECANLNTSHATVTVNNCEMDGRLAASVNPARPRRCGPVMFNNEVECTIRDSWMHHSNQSRYAVNDENYDSAAPYEVINCQLDHISDEPWSDDLIATKPPAEPHPSACVIGYESVAGPLFIDGSVLRVDNSGLEPGTTAVPMHISVAAAGDRNPEGGTLTVKDCIGVWPVHPQLNGFLGLRIYANTFFYRDGIENTVTVLRNGQRLEPWTPEGSWPPSKDYIALSGVSPESHYILKTGNS